MFYKFILTLVFITLGFVNSYGEEFTSGGIKYRVIDRGCEVTYNGSTIGGAYRGGYSGNITIPEYVTGPALWYGESSHTYEVTRIGDYAFDSCEDVNSISLPNTILSIGKEAFDYCINVRSLSLGDKLQTIEEEAFTSSGLRSIAIPNSVTKLGRGAFYECWSLNSVTIGNLIDSIQPSTFASCENLTSVFLPNSVSYIGNKAFQSCRKLSQIDLPLYLQSIGDYAFDDCVISNITIPSWVTSIGNSAFNSNLTEVTCKAITPPTIQENTFDDPANMTLIVPNESYKTAPYWEDFGTIICSDELNSNETFTADGLCYEITSPADQQCQIVGRLSGLPKDVVIPETITHNGVTYTVTNIATNALDNIVVDSLVIPHNVTISPKAINDATIGTLTINTDVKSGGDRISNSKITELIITPQVENFWNTLYGNTISKLTIEDSDQAISNAGFSSSGTKEVYMGRNFSNGALILNDLEKITIADNVTQYSGERFMCCPNIRTVISYNVVPPVDSDANEYLFTEATYTNGKLYVPVESIQAYKEAEGWKKFQYINAAIAFGPTFVVDGVVYNITSESDFKCEVCGTTEDVPNDIDIPTTVEYDGISFDVIGIRNAFNSGSFGTIYIPNSIQYIINSFDNSTIEKLITNLESNGPSNCQIGELVYSSQVTSVYNSLSSCSIRKLTFEDREPDWSGFYTPIRLGDEYHTFDGFQCTGLEEMYIGRNFSAPYSPKLGTFTIEKVSFGPHISSNYGYFRSVKTVCSYSTNPPYMMSGFDDDTYANGTLYVPDESVETYASANCWKEFFSIKPLSEYSGLHNVVVNKTPQVEVIGRSILIGENSNNILVANLSGTVLYSGHGGTTINVTPGIYIVTEGTKASKIAVK